MPPTKAPALANSEYQVGWICALSLEMTAARAMLDEIHDQPQEQDSSDHNNYCLGRIQKHNIVIACLSDYATTSAAVVAEQMLHSFKEIRFGLMVGIGGGVPSAKYDIRLGDVVVSRPEGTLGGVVQYDFGKAVADGRLERTGSLDRPPQLLLTALHTLESTHDMEDSKISLFLEQMSTNYPKMAKKYGYPSPGQDRLFKADYDHPNSLLNCDSCDASQLIDRQTRESNGPRIYYGLIASGNQVIKHGLTRLRHGEDLGVLCFEMEAAGLMNHFKCLVIRGICDYSDSHKNKKWQPYAATTAAAYAKELLLVIPAQKVQLEGPIVQVADPELQQLAKNHLATINEQNEKVNARYMDERNLQCHQVFKTSEYERHKNRNPDRVEGTCQWVFNHDQYKSWLKSIHNNLLWISADPGCGKSVLSKSLIDGQFKISEHLTCYFFFKDNDEQNSLSTALCALLHQFFSFRPHLLSHAFPCWDKYGETLRRETRELWRILISSATDPAAGNIICVLDALDECANEGRQQLINMLTDFYNNSISKAPGKSMLKFLVTSRPYYDIDRQFRGITNGLPTVRLAGEEENKQISIEIDHVIRAWVCKLAAEINLQPYRQEKLQTRLQQINHRTYLWLYLVFEEICKSLKQTEKRFNKIIDELPESVDEAYESILSKSTDRQEAKALLSIIIAATRPLTLKEMDVAFALASQDDASCFKDLDLDREHLKTRIRNLCGLFVYVSDGRIQLFHQTAKEFLVKTDLRSGKRPGLWKQSLDKQDCELIMAKTCIRCLLLDDFEDPHKFGVRGTISGDRDDALDAEPIESDERGHKGDRIGSPVSKILYSSAANLPGGSRRTAADEECRCEKCKYKQRVQSHDFVVYSAKHWPEHFRKADMDKSIEEFSLSLTLSDTNSPRFGVWFPIYWKIESKHSRSGFYSIPNRTSLQFAAYAGHNKIVQHLLNSENIEIDAIDATGNSALSYAIVKNHYVVVQLLLEKDADINVHCGGYNSTLEAAAAYGWKMIARLLIEKGANQYNEALSYAVYGGNIEIVQLLIEKGANEYNKALSEAAFGGNIEIVRLLIEKGANQYNKALRHAARCGHIEIVRLLIENGADDYNGALEKAAASGSLKIINFLIEKGADDYSGALQAATEAYKRIAGQHWESYSDSAVMQLVNLNRRRLQVIELLEKKIVDLDVKGSKQFLPPDNDSISAKGASIQT